MNTRRITSALLVIEIALAAILFTGSVSRADNLDVNSIIRESGLNSNRYAQCAGDIYSLFSGNLEDKASQMVSDAMSAMLEKMVSQLQTAAVCAVKSFIAKLTIGAATAVERVGGAFSECNDIQNSDMATQAVEMMEDSAKANFLSSCTSDVGYDYIAQTVVGMIQTQGPDGGMAAATDWTYMASVRPAEMAQRQWWTMLVNTNICPWFRDEVLNDLGVPQSYRDDPPPINAMGYRVDERAPFAVRAGCTLPANFDISDTSEAGIKKNGGYYILDALMEPQNNPRDFMAMALQEFETQKITLQNDVSDQLVSGGGFTGTFGECTKDANGKCIDDGSMKVVPGALRDYNAAETNSYYTRLAAATGDEGLLTDVSAQLQIRLLDLANAPLPLSLELGPERNPVNDTPRPTPTTSSTPADPTCVAPAGCTCLGNNDPASMLINGVANAIAEAILAQPGIFLNGTGQITGDPRLALQAVCDNYGSPTMCFPHPSLNDSIVLNMGAAGTVVFKIINSSGFVDTTGGVPSMSCNPGVLD